MVIWLSGAAQRMHAGYFGPTLGLMLSGDKGYAPGPGVVFAIDNGVYSGRFDEARWLALLERRRSHQDRCLFVVAPDVLHQERDAAGKIVRVWGDPEATYARFWGYAPIIREMGYRVAFVSQDGATSDLIPWEDIDCLFVGGGNAWKLCDRSIALIREAQERGLWTHMGRCQARQSIGGRIGAAHALGMDSGDGTVLARDPSRIGRVTRGLDALNAQMSLESAV